ncbi:RHS repeat-associated core domain-containing protein [Teredinibacter turnerae]|uniref:RHS repeat domain-containing protein n=1 Tax=Teredinibacter turnerae TaxID=2426 RepID=UPI0030D2D50D
MKNSIKIPVKSLRLVLTMCLLFFPQLPAHAEPELYFVHNDHLNTPQMLTDQNGQVVWKVESQTPFGVVVVNEDVDQDGQAIEFNIRFPGQYYDSETGLSYNYFRDYDPLLGRYVQSDPIGLGGGINTYGYVSSNPTKYYDKFGLLQQCETGISSTGGKDIGPAHHDYHCFRGRNGKMKCRGFSFEEEQNPGLKDKILGPIKGDILKDEENLGGGNQEYCGEDDNNLCMDRCVEFKWESLEDHTPKYGLVFGESCQSIVDEIYKQCDRICN